MPKRDGVLRPYFIYNSNRNWLTHAFQSNCCYEVKTNLRQLSYALFVCLYFLAYILEEIVLTLLYWTCNLLI